MGADILSDSPEMSEFLYREAVTTKCKCIKMINLILLAYFSLYKCLFSPRWASVNQGACVLRIASLNRKIMKSTR